MRYAPTVKKVTVEQMNTLLEYAENHCLVISDRPPHDWRQISYTDAYIMFGALKVILVMYFNGGMTQYEARLDGMENIVTVDGADAYRILRRYSKFHIFNESDVGIYGSASPFLWKNDKYEGKKVKAYAYDMNASYSWGMLQKMPATEQLRTGDIVREGEIGFSWDMELVPPGQLAVYVCPLVESPFRRFVETYYTRKQKHKGTDKANDKAILNYSVGYLQLVNPFLRAAIMGWSKVYVTSLMDQNTIYSNTDCIVSLKERPDLKIGDEIGQWKLEHYGDFAFVGFNCQWYNDTVAYRGVPKAWFNAATYDILTDEIPTGNLNPYIFDPAKLRILKKEV